MNKPIGIFDSGIGGITILKELISELPQESFIYIADSKHAPYGPKSEEEIVYLTSKLSEFLIQKDCKLIVVACNTATAAAIHTLRTRFKIPVIGLEPAVKPACLKTKTGNVGVLATEGTFRGNHFINTSNKYKDYVTLHLQVAKGLVELAENLNFEGDCVHNLIKKYLEYFKDKNIDYLVLGCTHYPYFYNIIQEYLGNQVKVIDSGEAIARRVKDILMTNRMLNSTSNFQELTFFSTGDKKALEYVVEKELVILKEMIIVEKINFD